MKALLPTIGTIVPIKSIFQLNDINQELCAISYSKWSKLKLPRKMLNINKSVKKLINYSLIIEYMFADEKNRKNIIERIMNTLISFDRINHFLLIKREDLVEVINPSPTINQSIKKMFEIHEKNNHKYSDKGNNEDFWKQLHSVMQFDNKDDFNYNLKNHIKPQQISIKTRSRSSTKTKKHNPSDYFGRFSVISTLHSAIRLAVYNCSHRQGKIPVIHRKSKIIVEIPEGCQIIFNCGLYHHGVKSWLSTCGQ